LAAGLVSPVVLVVVAVVFVSAGVAEAVAATGAGWQLLQDHVVAELHMRELDMQVGVWVGVV
jgi:hypothetical protein